MLKNDKLNYLVELKLIMNKIIFAILFFMVGSFYVYADSIEVEARSVIIDENSGISIYSGDVKFIQKGAIFSAETIELFNNSDYKIVKMVAKGSAKEPARYKQEQTANGELIDVKADSIIYLVEEKIIQLIGKVSFVKGANYFSGDIFYYDIAKDKITIKQSKDSKDKVKFKLSI